MLDWIRKTVGLYAKADFVAVGLAGAVLGVLLAIAPGCGDPEPADPPPVPRFGHAADARLGIDTTDGVQGPELDKALNFVAANPDSAPAGDLPPLLSVVYWLAQYDIHVVLRAPRMISAAIPTDGTPVARYQWVLETTTDGGLTPPGDAADLGLRTSMEIWVGTQVDSMRVRVRGVDAAGIAGPFSEWSSWADW